MTHRERLKRVFRCQQVDRMPVRIWGVSSVFPSERLNLYANLLRNMTLKLLNSGGPQKKKFLYPLMK